MAHRVKSLGIFCHFKKEVNDEVIVSNPVDP